ncbi:PQ-loop domain-containing transporter [Legionella cardiaca]|uniref:PQ-loop domain-containing transporter n=1 Tax=Legionella cardiaca TaxID=1071983 RepID=UPI003B84A9F0
MIANLMLLIATILLMVSFIPFIRKILRNKNSKGVSLTMMILGILQSLSFILHDIYFERYMMIIPFAVITIFFITLSVFTIKYR